MFDAIARRRPAFLLGRVALARPRLLSGVAAAGFVFAVAPAAWGPSTRFLVAWNVGTALYIAASLVAAGLATPQTIRWRARITDEGRFAILALVTLATFASMIAIVAQLGITKSLTGFDKSLHLGLAALTIITAWVFIHLSYAMHYAHEYFDETKTLPGEAPAVKGGVAFPGTDEPDYWDFFYFAFIIGVAAQTADVAITSKAIRRTSLAHSILSFFFNSAILALTINIAAGLI